MTEVISVQYKRIPKTELYMGEIVLYREESQNTLTRAETLFQFRDMRLEEVVRRLHQELKSRPEARVLMQQEVTRIGAKDKKYKTHEFDTHLRNVIRDDLDEALRMFAPIRHEEINRTV
jgi:hypothetical protein